MFLGAYAVLEDASAANSKLICEVAAAYHTMISTNLPWLMIGFVLCYMTLFLFFTMIFWSIQGVLLQHV